jgi:amidase
MDRRKFLQCSIQVVAGALIVPSATAIAKDSPTAVASMSSFARLDATSQAQLVAKGEVTPLELLEDAIRRIETLNPKINAVVLSLFDQARTAARGPLPDGPFKGVPYAIKDEFDLKGTRRTAGSRLLANNISTETSPIVARSIAAGFLVLGKTNMPEFGLNATTESIFLGTCRNPWNLEHSSGGSSGGTAAAVASGMLPIASAADGGGSIRIPASCCGVFGFKPSRGRMVGSGDDPGQIGVDHAISRSVRDSASLFAWNERQDANARLPAIGLISSPSSARRTIGFSTKDVLGLEPTAAVKAEIERTAQHCRTLGHRVEEATLPVDGHELMKNFVVLWGHDGDRIVNLAKSMGVRPDDVLEPWTLYLSEHFGSQPPQAIHAAFYYFAELSRRFDDFFQRYDLMLSPVLHSEAPPLGYLGPQTPPEVMLDRLRTYVSYTPVYNVTGLPAMSVPLGLSPSGLPIGSHFASRLGNDRMLFELAYELEQSAPWAERWPR